MKLVDKVLLAFSGICIVLIVTSRKYTSGASCVSLNSERIRKLVNSSKANLAAAKQDNDPLFAYMHIQEARLLADTASEFITNFEAKKHLDLDLDAFRQNLYDMQEDIRRVARRSIPSLSF